MAKCQYWCFTINNPEGELDFESVGQVKYAVYQLEEGDQGTPHYQGYIEFVTRKSLAALKKFPTVFAKAHWETRKGTALQAAEYCKKEEGRLSGPWEYGTPPEERECGKRSDLQEVKELLLAGGSKRDVLDNYAEVLAKYPRFVEHCIQEYVKSTVNAMEAFEPLYPWQKVIQKKLLEVPDSRTITWVYDPIGNKGKTYMARWLVQEHGAFYTNGGKHTDIAYAYNGEKIVIFDYVRDSKEYVGYGVIEQLKNGIMFSPKYEAGMKVFNIPHVVVFANFPPEDGKFSSDRVKLVELDSVGSCL